MTAIRILCSSLVLLAAQAPGLAWAGEAGVAEILASYAKDYESDPMILDVTFGIKVANDMWTIVSVPGKEGAPGQVTLTHQAPAAPTFYFTIDTLENLRKIEDGTMNFQTAAVRAFSSDYAPADADAMEGFEPGPDFPASMFSAMFHFWTRGLPELIPFGAEHTRFTHGANAAIFYYQEGFRSGWIYMKPGEHANEDPRSQVNDFPSLMIITKGKGIAKIGGKELEITEGAGILIPPGITHEFWNPGDAPMEGILLMFGEGA